MTSNYFNRPTGTIHSLQWVFAIPFYNFTSMCNLSAVYRDKSLSKLHPDEILIVHLPGSCKNPLQKIGNLLYRLTVRWHSSQTPTPSTLENLFLDKYILLDLENLDSSLIKIIMTSKLLPTYRDL